MKRTIGEWLDDHYAAETLVCFAVLALLLMLVAGCATTTNPQPTVVTNVRTETVKVPVLIPCVYEDELPKVPGTWMAEGLSKDKLRLAVLADLKEAEDYITRADSLLRGCAKPREAEK